MSNPIIDSMFKAGAHFGTAKSRRHPTASPYIFGRKNNVEIFDLEKTVLLLEKAKAFISSVAKENKQIILVGGKSESREAIRNAGMSLALPYVDGRWIGGTFTNFGEIRKRIEKFQKLIEDREKGALGKYTKRERLMIDREIANFEKNFAGIVTMKELPKAMFVIDPRKEKNAIKEAKDMNIPIITLAGADCNLKDALYPIVGNDASKSSIEFFVSEFIKAWNAGKI
ncbi:MAG: 30S ribosomal protein S2 [bacterium]|nr:30S ribosomal protein S2 [bacterium]